MASPFSVRPPRRAHQPRGTQAARPAARATPCQAAQGARNQARDRNSGDDRRKFSQHHRHNYSQLLILNAGGGYHVLLAGMERISVDLGQFVVTGEPVAVMGGGVSSTGVLAGGSGQPVLYVEFRKDGVPVDPGPWWAATEAQKVRG